MYYCNKCGQEMVDSGHRCAVQSERISSVVRSNATNGWISVMDSEPDSLDEVLTYSKNAGLGISFFSNGSWYDYGTTEWIDVTHWMPLPEPPIV